jgi:hypothetical protein
MGADEWEFSNSSATQQLISRSSIHSEADEKELCTN